MTNMTTIDNTLQLVIVGVQEEWLWLMQYIIRNTHENYTAINNAFLQDSNLKPATIGILVVILSNKPDWIVYPDEIARRLNISRNTVDSHFKILEKAGYMRVVKRSLGRGKGSEIHRFFSDVPITDSYLEYLKSNLEKELSTEKSDQVLQFPKIAM